MTAAARGNRAPPPSVRPTPAPAHAAAHAVSHYAPPNQLLSLTPLQIESLPDELLKLITSYLPTPDLKSIALVSTWLYPHATELLWRSVCLADTSRWHLLEENTTPLSTTTVSDEHDDTPIIQKLLILASNPNLASQVQVLTHRCHLPTPTIFSELPYMHFDAENISFDPRIHRLLRLAISNLVNVQTLRIIYGHWHITSTLLEGFLDPRRQRRIPLRKLWLESCSLKGAKIDFENLSLLDGLESIRIRRLRAESADPDLAIAKQFPEYTLARGGVRFQLHDGAGGWVTSTVEFSDVDAPISRPQVPQHTVDAAVTEFDSAIWEDIEDTKHLVDDSPERYSPANGQAPRIPIQHLFAMSSATLTKLNLDWVLWRPSSRDDADDLAVSTLDALAKMRFPHLRSFQVRNAVVTMTRLPPNVYLLESTFLEFLEAHPKIQCLAWPLDRFYSHIKPSQDVLTRSRQLVAHLGTSLVDLRLDSYYNNNGEMFTDDASGSIIKEHERYRRRRFVSEFAPYMSRLQSIKLEGGIPRDEKREILRALHACPLKKIVMIGVAFPIGNTWGYRGEDLRELDEGVGDTIYELEEEDKEALVTSFTETPAPLISREFSASYGWPAGPPFLHTIASYHADTVEELKLCGYNGSPVLSRFLPVTKPLLYPLQHFHNLRQLVISLWLLTYFEDGYRDTEIIQSWKDTRSPSSTALVVVTPPATPTPQHPIVYPTMAPEFPSPVARPQDYNRWAVALKTRFTPSALAYRVAADIGPYLSPDAKERPGGVRVRASFCLGARDDQRWANDIFDLDIRIGAANQVLEFIGPREEGEKGRWWDKLENRRWF